MKRGFSFFCITVLLLPVLVSCVSSLPSNTSISEETATLRPVETIEIICTWQGELLEFPEDFTPHLLYGYCANELFYLRGTKQLPEQKPAYYIVSPSDGIIGCREIPYEPTITKQNERNGILLETVGEKGSVVLYNTSNYDPKTNKTISYNRSYLTVYDREGNPRFCIDPEPMVKVRENPLTGSDIDFLFYPELYYAANGTVYMIHDCSAVAISEAGEKLYETAPGYYFYDSLLTADGRVMVQAADVKKSSEPFWAYLDDSIKGLSEPIDVPDPGLQEYTLLMGGGHDFYFNAREGLYFMDAGDTEPTLFCSWEETGIHYDTLRYVLIADKETICVMLTDADGAKKYGVLTTSEELSIAARQVITLGEEYVHIDFEKYAAAFNRISDKYRIVIRDYEKIRKDGGNTLQEDILAGNAPDVIFFHSSVTEHLADKGVYADLNGFLESDPAFREDIVDGILKSCETDGHLYYLASGVQLKGMMGKAKNLPSSEEWTISKYLSLAAEDTGENDVQFTMTDQTIRDTLLYNNLASFVDFENGICSFENEDFLALLRYLKALPAKGNEFNITLASGERFDAYRKDKLLLGTAYVQKPEQYLRLRAMFNGEELVWLGTPTPSGSCLVLGLAPSFSISADSPVKEGAWEFIRYMMTEVLLHINSPLSYFPVTESAIRQEMTKSGKSFYMFSLQNTGFTTKIWDGVTPPEEYDPVTQAGAWFTEEDADILLDLLNNRTYSISTTAAYETVRDLVREEVEAFLAGTSSAEDTAKKIQSRVNIYLAEQSK